MSKAECTRRVTELDHVDLATLLGQALVQIKGDLDRRQVVKALQQLNAWADSLGIPIGLASEQVRVFRARPGFQAAVRDFAAANQTRAMGIRRLAEAIRSGSEREVARWRWVGRAYGFAIERFLAEQELRHLVKAERDEAASELKSTGLLRHSILSLLINHYRLADEESADQPHRQLNAVQRMKEIVADAAERNRARELREDQLDQAIQELRPSLSEQILRQMKNSSGYRERSELLESEIRARELTRRRDDRRGILSQKRLELSHLTRMIVAKPLP